MESAHKEKMEKFEKICEEKFSAAREMFKKEAATLNKQVELAQQREDALAKDVKSLRSTMEKFAPALELLSGDNLKNLLKSVVQETLKANLKENLADEFTEQKSALDSKIAETLTPLHSLVIIAERLAEKKKSVASGSTVQQGGDLNVRQYITRTGSRGLPPITTATTFGFTSFSSGSTLSQPITQSAPSYTSIPTPGSSSIPTGSSSTIAASSSASTIAQTSGTAGPSSSSQTKETDLTLEEKMEFVKEFRSRTKLFDAVTPEDELKHPLIERCGYLYNSVHSSSIYFGIKPVMYFNTKIPDNREFDYGLSPRGFCYHTHHPGSGDFYGSPLFKTRMIMWHATYIQEHKYVWSTWKIVEVSSLKVAEKFLGFNNLCISCERANGMKFKFTFADLPNMNLADILNIIDGWKDSKQPVLVWGCAYLKRYVYFLFKDFARQDIELASIVTDQLPQPDCEYRGTEALRPQIGEVSMENGSGPGLQVYYEAVSESGKINMRILRISQASRYTSVLINSLITHLETCPANLRKRKMKNEAVEYLTWLLEFRSRMAAIPGIVFPELMEESRLRAMGDLVQMVEEPND